VPRPESSRSQQLARTSIPARVPAFRLAAGPQASSRRGNCAGGTHRPARHSADERDSGSLPCDPDNEQYVAVSSGTGKSHLAAALGVEAVRAGRSVYFSPLADIIESLAKADREGRLRERIRYLCRASLLIIDEIGYLSLGAPAGNLFFQLVNARYEKGAMILTSNRGFAEWGEVFGDPVVATALLDRLLHHAVVVHMKGTQTVFAGHSSGRRLRRAVQGYAEPDFDLPSLDPDLVDEQA
jgi:IstB-like ATP binding protein